MRQTTKFFLLALFCLGYGHRMFSQSNKQPLSTDQYEQWSGVGEMTASATAKWVAFKLYYHDKGVDTQLVVHKDGTKRYVFPHASNGVFGADQWFAFRDSTNNIILVDLWSGSRLSFAGVKTFNFAQDGKFMIVHHSDSQLVIHRLSDHSQKTLTAVTAMLIHEPTGALAVVQRQPSHTTLSLVKISDVSSHVVAYNDTACTVEDLVWQSSGESIAFIRYQLANDRPKAVSLGLYRRKAARLEHFLPEQYDAFPQDALLSNNNKVLRISDDGQRIFFGMHRATADDWKPSPAQVWNAADKRIFPSQLPRGFDQLQKIGVWFPDRRVMRVITDNQFPYMMLADDGKQAIIYNKSDYQPQYDFDPPLRYYITTLTEDGKRSKLLDSVDRIVISPESKYAYYFKESHWWVYDVQARKHACITGAIGTSMAQEEWDKPEPPYAYGLPGWAPDDKAVYVYDRYDVWKIAPDGTRRERLTRGREQHIVFRIVAREPGERRYLIGNYDGSTGACLNGTELLLEATGTDSSGIYRWTQKEGLKRVVYVPKKVSIIKSVPGVATVFYLEESYEQPPRIMTSIAIGRPSTILHATNPQHKLYEWGMAKKIHYTNKLGKALTGILYYPAGYDSSKLYPMVVHVYSRQSSLFRNYISPTKHAGVIFNVSNYTTQGYFVLLPDIVYELGNPGFSALDCVLAATETAVRSASIDRKKLGLTGHSFGGYETDFIISQTSIFAAAVAGAAITDFPTSYLTVNWQYSRANNWHYEFAQCRMAAPLFDNLDGYRKNSPITHVENINTPLLSYAGEEDRHVNRNQSLELYLALRRLGKKHILLLYPEEGHAIQDPVRQRDLTQKMQEWFDHYLKDQPLQGWMKESAR